MLESNVGFIQAVKFRPEEYCSTWIPSSHPQACVDPGLRDPKTKIERRKGPQTKEPALVIAIRGVEVWDLTTGQIRSEATDEITC